MPKMLFNTMNITDIPIDLAAFGFFRFFSGYGCGIGDRLGR